MLKFFKYTYYLLDDGAVACPPALSWRRRTPYTGCSGSWATPKRPASYHCVLP